MDDYITDAQLAEASRSPTETCWYTRQPLGQTLLGGTVARLCKQAGIEGYKTNHSLRATTTTRRMKKE